MNRKVWGSAGIDFAITAGTAFLAIPQDADITLRSLLTIIVGAAVATGKGMQTYRARYPEKSLELPR